MSEAERDFEILRRATRHPSPVYYFRKRIENTEFEVGFACLRELEEFILELGRWKDSGLGYSKEHK